MLFKNSAIYLFYQTKSNNVFLLYVYCFIIKEVEFHVFFNYKEKQHKEKKLLLFYFYFLLLNLLPTSSIYISIYISNFYYIFIQFQMKKIK